MEAVSGVKRVAYTVAELGHIDYRKFFHYIVPDVINPKYVARLDVQNSNLETKLKDMGEMCEGGYCAGRGDSKVGSSDSKEKEVVLQAARTIKRGVVGCLAFNNSLRGGTKDELNSINT